MPTGKIYCAIEILILVNIDYKQSFVGSICTTFLNWRLLNNLLENHDKDKNEFPREKHSGFKDVTNCYIKLGNAQIIIRKLELLVFKGHNIHVCLCIIPFS